VPVYVPNSTPGAIDPADLMEQLGAEIAARYADAERQMIERVARLVAAGVDVPEDFVERQKILALLRREGAELAATLRDPDYVRRIIAIAASQGEAAAIAQLGRFAQIADTGRSGISSSATRAIGQIALDLSNGLDDMSARITRWMPDVYQRAIALVSPSVILGVDTLRQAQARAASNLIAQGVVGFVAENGAQWKIGTYAEMATRTSVNRAWMDSNNFAMQQQGINLVSIIVGANACAKCAAHSGKIYSLDGTPAGVYQLESAISDELVSVTVAGTLGEARAQGWNHPNCRCVTVAYLPGLSIAEGSRYDPAKEAARDRLRELERRVRDLKRREAAAFDDVTKANLRRRIRQAQADIRGHVAESGILRRSYRESLSWSDGHGSGPIPGGTPRPPRPRPVDPAPVRPAIAAPVLTPDVAAMSVALDVARAATARRGLAEAKTPREIGAVLEQAFPTIRFGNFTARVAVESAREIAEAVLDMLTKYSLPAMRQINLTALQPGVVAHAKGRFVPGNGRKRLLSTDVEVSTRYVGAEQRQAMLDALGDDTTIGHFHPHDVAHLRYTVFHEFGHVMDYNGLMRIRGEIPTILREFGGPVAEQVSGYGRTHVAELVAEAFADVEVNGENARALSRRIHARLIEIYEEERLL
jgi:hypothetical protein